MEKKKKKKKKKKQIADESFDLEANLALLKLYQFYPSKMQNITTVQQVLMLALQDLPSNAFVLSTYLLNDKVRETKEIQTILSAHSLLEECRFKEFWVSAEFKHLTELMSSLTKFTSSIREFAFNVLAASHQRCEKSLAEEVLNLTNQQLVLFLKRKSVTIDGEVITFPLTEFNQRRAQEVQSSIQVGYVARIF